MNYPFVPCAFCKARYEGPAHRCLTGPLAFPEPPPRPRTTSAVSRTAGMPHGASRRSHRSTRVSGDHHWAVLLLRLRP